MGWKILIVITNSQDDIYENSFHQTIYSLRKNHFSDFLTR